MQRVCRLADGLWSVEGTLTRGWSPLSLRMTVLRLSGGELVVNSPIELDDALRAEIDALGPVRYVVAPNRAHHYYVPDAGRAWPEARLLAAPGLPEKRRDVHFTETIGEGTVSEWKGEIETHLVVGIPFLNEVVLFHRGSRTLVLTDLCFNVHRAPSAALRLFFRLNGAWQRFGPSRLLRLMVRDGSGVERSIRRILEWDFDRIVVTHGDIVETGGREALRAAWLG